MQQSLCIHRRFASWRVSTTYCSTPHLRASIASLVIQKLPQLLMASLTSTVNRAKGRRGSTLVYHLQISCRALNFGFFWRGGGSALWIFLGLSCFLGHFTAVVGGLGSATQVLVNSTSTLEERVGSATTLLAITTGTVNSSTVSVDTMEIGLALSLYNTVSAGEGTGNYTHTHSTHSKF